RASVRVRRRVARRAGAREGRVRAGARAPAVVRVTMRPTSAEWEQRLAGRGRSAWSPSWPRTARWEHSNARPPAPGHATRDVNETRSRSPRPRCLATCPGTEPATASNPATCCTKQRMFLDVNGVRLHAVVFGDGPRTLVATGGWTGSWEVWEDPSGLLTADGWRCVAYDHRGSGESPVDPALITVDAMTDDVVGVLDALGVESCVLAGESQGGAIAQYAAARHPERFSGLVLSAPSRTGRSEGGGGFADACRADYPAAVNAFVDLCFP